MSEQPVFACHDGDLFHRGCFLSPHIAERLLDRLEADREPYAQALAAELRTALHEAANHEHEATA